MRYYIKLLAIPLLLLVLFSSLFIIWKVVDLPPTDELVEIVKVWFDRYGLPFIFLSSIIEGMLLIGSYFPGVFVIFLGVILSSSILQATQVVAVVTAGLFVAHIINYVLGKYGWYRLLVRFGMKGAVEQARERLVKRGPIAIFSSYWLPSVGALTDTAAGIMRMPFKKFFCYSLISVTLWDIVAGVLVYSFKDSALVLAIPTSGSKIIFSVIGIWIVFTLGADFYKRRKSSGAHTIDKEGLL
jgi:membrane protein DedA with SNARE-associated domain